MHYPRLLSGVIATGSLISVMGLGGAAVGDDTFNPQQTVPTCALQGGACPSGDSGPLTLGSGGDTTSSSAPSPAGPSPAESAALDWARSMLGSSQYQLLCQQFVHDAYLNGAGVDIGSGSAIDYWNSHPELQHPGDTNPPAGALVYWGPTPNNQYGHVGIAEGGDAVISSEERSTMTIHEFSIADRNSSGYYPYLGWLMPD